MFSSCDTVALVPSRDFIESMIDRAVALAAATIKAVPGLARDTVAVSARIAPVIARAAINQCRVFAGIVCFAFLALKQIVNLAMELWCFVVDVGDAEYAIACEVSSGINNALNYS